MQGFFVCSFFMTVITISRQAGSNGRQIAEQAAALLGYRIVWREVINQAALRAGAPAMALAMIDELNLLGVCPSEEECQTYLLAVEQVVKELAQQGNVIIVGRAGLCILADHPQALHVRIIAPQELRALRLVERHAISLSAARAQVKARDRYRRDYLRRFYQVDWNDPAHYDLVINSARLSNAAAAELIYQLVNVQTAGAPG